MPKTKYFVTADIAGSAETFEFDDITNACKQARNLAEDALTGDTPEDWSLTFNKEMAVEEGTRGELTKAFNDAIGALSAGADPAEVATMVNDRINAVMPKEDEGAAAKSEKAPESGDVAATDQAQP